MVTSRRLILILVWVLLINGPWFSFNQTSDNQILCPLDQFEDLDIADAIPDEIGPSMRYYLRKYAPHFAQTLSSVNLSIFTEDITGVDTVILMYSQKKGDSDNVSIATQDVGAWVNVTMDYQSEGWYETIIPVLNISEPNLWCSYLVKYAANDTLGNWNVSPLCIYMFSYSTTTADWFGIELCDTPDLWYVAGTNNHTITWDVAPDMHGQSGWPYSIYEDGYLTELWRWTGSITIDVTGLGIDNYTFELYLQVAWSVKAYDMVMVHVVETPEEIPLGVATDWVGPIIVSDEVVSDPFIPVYIIGSACFILLIIWMKRRT